MLRWVGTDHLGSTIRVADASFLPLDQQRYTPYGMRRNSPPEGLNLGTDQRFTGQTEDSSIGLSWYASRAYDPALGRFLQPDTIVPNPANPQDLNRYSYVRNNPVKYSDPTGHEPWAQGLNATAEIEIQSEPLIFLPPEPTKPNIFINTNPGGGAWIFVGPESSQPNIFVPPQPTGPIVDSFPEQGGGVLAANRGSLKEWGEWRSKDPEVADMANKLGGRAPGIVTGVNEKVKVKRQVAGDNDNVTKTAIIEVMRGNGAAGLQKVEDRSTGPFSSSLNPENKPVVVYAERMDARNAEVINKANGIAATLVKEKR